VAAPPGSVEQVTQVFLDKELTYLLIPYQINDTELFATRMFGWTQMANGTDVMDSGKRKGL